MGSWTPLGSAVRYTRGKLTLREDGWRLPDGSQQIYPVLAAGVAVGILPFVEPDRVLLVRQYRHLVGAASWEVPGGGARPGEDPAVAAQRELREEAGYRAARMELLTRFHPANAYLDETGYCFVATGLTADPLPADEDEFIERAVLPLDEVIRMTLDGEITESYTKVAVLQYALTRR